jgi:hypothetical protein
MKTMTMMMPEIVMRTKTMTALLQKLLRSPAPVVAADALLDADQIPLQRQFLMNPPCSPLKWFLLSFGWLKAA